MARNRLYWPAEHGQPNKYVYHAAQRSTQGRASRSSQDRHLLTDCSFFFADYGHLQCLLSGRQPIHGAAHRRARACPQHLGATQGPDQRRIEGRWERNSGHRETWLDGPHQTRTILRLHDRAGGDADVDAAAAAAWALCIPPGDGPSRQQPSESDPSGAGKLPTWAARPPGALGQAPQRPWPEPGDPLAAWSSCA